jgi:hypothetical protein
MNKIPDRAVVNLHATLSKLRHQSPQGKVRSHSPQKPITVAAHQNLGAMPAHLPRCRTSGLARPLRPLNNARRANRKHRRDRADTLSQTNPGNRTLTQIQGIRLRHPYWPPSSIKVESPQCRFGNPTDSNKNHPALNRRLVRLDCLLGVDFH